MCNCFSNRKVPRVHQVNLENLSAEDELAHLESNVLNDLALRSICVLQFITEAFEL